MSDVKAQLKRRMAQLKALKAAGKMSSAAKCALIVKKLKRQYVAQRNAAQADGSPPAQSAPRRANRTKRVVVVEGEATTLDVGSAAGGGASAPRVTLNSRSSFSAIETVLPLLRSTPSTTASPHATPTPSPSRTSRPSIATELSASGPCCGSSAAASLAMEFPRLLRRSSASISSSDFSA
jgi:hypothetical protein